MTPILQHASILFAAALAGSALPLLVKRADRPLHLLLALAAGVFLGVVFLHLLPEVADSAGEGSPLWLCVLLGVAGLFVLQNLIFKGEGHAHHHAPSGSSHGRHVALGYASFLGLAVHAFTAGVGLSAAAQTQQRLGDSLYLSILGHKIPESFSLATVFLLTGLPLRRIGLLIVFFALTTPAGMLLGSWLAGGLTTSGVEILAALAAGTFLYVAVADLLPEVFHNRDDVVLRLILVAAGVSLTAWVPELGG